jgi:FkbM family methyltransferase
MNITLFKLRLFLNVKLKIKKKIFPLTRLLLLNKKSAQIADQFFFECIKILKIKQFIEAGAREAYASKKLALTGIEAIAIEANPLTFNMITLPNSNQIKCINCGVGAFKDEVNFYIPVNDLMAGNATFQPNEFDNYIIKKIKVEKIDDIINNNNFGHKLCALWIDVEGYQKQVLEGAQKILSNQNLLIIKIELEEVELFKGQSTAEVINDVLKKFEFEPVFCDDEYGCQFNCIYIRKFAINLIRPCLKKSLFELENFNPPLLQTLNLLLQTKKQALLTLLKKWSIYILGEKKGNQLSAFFGSKTSKNKNFLNVK